MNGLHILGTGRAVPPHIVTNDDLAQRVETNDEWIVTRTGIHERRYAQPGETLTALTVTAARQALERAGLKPEDIGLCITATVTPDRLTPAQACLIHQELGLPEDCPAFDLGAGCTGFLYAMETAAAMLPRMNRPYALLVGGELLSRIVDMDDRSTVVTGRSVDAPVRCLRNQMTNAYIAKEREGADRMELEHFTLGGLRKAVFDGDVKTGSVMAGQVAGMLHEIKPLRQIFEELQAGCEQRLRELEK